MSSKAPALRWLLPAVVFLAVAVVQLVRQGGHGTTFLVLGLVFLVLSLTVAARGRMTKPPPPAV